MALSTKRLRVGIFTSNRLLREYLSRTIRAHMDLLFPISDARTPSTADTDIILVDSYDACPEIVTKWLASTRKSKVVLINGDSNSIDILQCIRSGVTGFIPKD